MWDHLFPLKILKRIQRIGNLFCNYIKVINIWLRVYWMLRKLPGPPANPILGHGEVFLSSHRFMNKLLKWRDKYPLCQKAYMMFYPLVLVYAPEAVQEILSKKQKHNDKGNVYHALIPLLGDGLITSKGEKWFTHRRLVTPAFHFNILESFFEIFKVRTLDYISELKNSDITKGYLDICPFTKSLTLNLICETAMGSSTEVKGMQQREIVNAMHRLEQISTQRCVYPWLLNDWIFKWTKLYREQEKYKKLLHEFTDKVINNRRRSLFEDNIPDFKGKNGRNIILIDLLLNQSLNGRNLTNEEIREEITTFMFAGQNTTQLAINYCLFLLGCYPHIQEKAYEEINAIFGDSHRDPSMNDLKRMYYLERCIKEALRLYPSVPIIARRLTEDQPIGEYILPKNTDCLILPFVIHRNPEQFPNPEVFNPDNFLQENSKKRHAYSYIPFSAGPRNCIGKRFANIVEKTVISWVLREFTIQSLEKQADIKIIPTTVLVPINGLKMKLKPRRK